MTHFVLVHGAWHGGWCWERVVRELHAAGHQVTAPTLSGLGWRAPEITPSLSLSDHVEDVVAAVDATRDDIVLVGHSYAGFVVREAADRLGDAVARLVLLDAWVGADGDSLLSVAPDWFSEALVEAARQDGGGWQVPVPPPALVGVEDPDDAAWLTSRLTPHPLKTFTDTTALTGVVDSVPAEAIVCSGSSGLPFADLATAFGWPIRRLDAGHDAMVTNPVDLARMLEDSAHAARP
jgi:pimeloyl-ACP methyl ester carboxylesterase